MSETSDKLDHTLQAYGRLEHRFYERGRENERLRAEVEEKERQRAGAVDGMLRLSGALTDARFELERLKGTVRAAAAEADVPVWLRARAQEDLA